MRKRTDSRDFAFNRRAFLGRYAGALGSLALGELLGRNILGARASGTTGSARALGATGFASAVGGTAQPAPRAARAKSVICLFQHGGPSQMDLFDPKPELTKRHGEPHPDQLEVHFHTKQGNLLASPFQFAPSGESGIELSELLPHTRGIADEMTLIRSMKTFSVDHEAALRLVHTGKLIAGRPTFGSWIVYALGSENNNVPAYVVLADPGGLPIDGLRNWSSGWLPARYQGTPFRAEGSPVLNLETPQDIPAAARAGQLEFLETLNRSHLNRYPHNSELEARVADFEMAARMQTAVPELMDLSGETEVTRKMYGLDRPESAEYGKRLLLARRLVESGVRFVQVFLNSQPWDTHDKNADRLRGLCAKTDQPSAALVQDLKQRGLLDSTIVLWTGEFGRLPISQDTDGRDHNRHGFSLWLAGGGFGRGYAHGATDDFGYAAVEDIVTVHDLHATLLRALGLDHLELTFPHDGRDDSLTDNVITGAQVVPELLEG